MCDATADVAVTLREGAVDLPGLTLAYVECGAGRPVVLLHGYTDSWHSFRRVLPGLSAHARCLAVDLRGHGRSAVPGDDYSLAAFAADVAAVVDRLGLGPAALVGHSMGSLVARRVALTRPDLVDRLVLVGAPFRIDTPAVRELAAEVAGFSGAVPRAYAEAFQAACVADRLAVPDEFFDGCVDASAGVPAGVWKAALGGLLADDDSGRLGRIGCPTLVIGGRADGFFPPADQAAVAGAVPRGRLLLYDGVGHSPHWEQPERFVADVTAFLEGPAG